MSTLTEAELVAMIDGGGKLELLRLEVPTDCSVADQSFLDTLRPPVPPPLFIGRAEELEHLDRFFRKDPARELVLLGDPSTGKTQLALRFAQVTMNYW